MQRSADRRRLLAWPRRSAGVLDLGEREAPLRWQEGVGSKLEPPDVGHPYGQAERRDQLNEALAWQGREVVEERVRDGREREATVALRGRLAREPAEAVVFPPQIRRACALMDDQQPPIERTADDASVA